MTKNDDDKNKGLGPTGEPLEYYDDFTNLDVVIAAATISLQDRNISVNYRPERPSASGAFNGDSSDVRGGNGSR